MSEKSSTRVTTNHEEIRRWVEERGGVPAKVKDTGGKDDVGILRIDFIENDGPEDGLEEIDWDDFFSEFENKKLAFLYQDDKDQSESRFFKIISREE